LLLCVRNVIETDAHFSVAVHLWTPKSAVILTVIIVQLEA